MLEQQLDQDGCAIIRSLLSAEACDEISALYGQPELFRSQVIMARHGFGRGEYKYFKYPLPDPVARLRSELYPALVPIANRWYECMDLPTRFAATHEAFLQRCHAAGQERPTPLLLQYAPRTTTACIRICTASTFSPCKWRFSWQNRARILLAANSS